MGITNCRMAKKKKGFQIKTTLKKSLKGTPILSNMNAFLVFQLDATFSLHTT